MDGLRAARNVYLNTSHGTGRNRALGPWLSSAPKPLRNGALGGVEPLAESRFDAKEQVDARKKPEAPQNGLPMIASRVETQIGTPAAGASRLANRGDTGDNKLWDQIENVGKDRATAAAPALTEIDSVIRNSAYGKRMGYSGARGTPPDIIVMPSQNSTARFRRFSHAESPGGINATGAGKIWISPELILKGSRAEVGALVIAHERTHERQFAAMPKFPLDKQLPIQAEVEAFEHQLMLYKELRPKLI